MTTTLAKLEAASVKARAAEDAAAAAHQRAEDARMERLRVFAREQLDSYDDAALGQQVRDAQRAFAAAVAESTLGAAWVRLKVAQMLRAHLAIEAQSNAGMVGDPRTITTRVADSAAFEELGRSVDRVAEGLVADELDARDAARDAVAEGLSPDAS